MPRMPKSPADTLPLYKQAELYISGHIRSGRWETGTALPSEWDLAAEIGVSQGTVRKALSNMTARGELQRQQGVGTFVTGLNPEWGAFPLHDEHTRRRNLWPKQEILSIAAANTPPAVRHNLQLAAGERIWYVQSLWRNGHHTIAYDEAWLPLPLLPDLNRLQLESRMGIYQLLAAEYGFMLDPAPTLLFSGSLDAETAAKLKSTPYAPAIRCERISHSGKRILEWRRRFMLLEHTALILPAST